MVNLFLFDIAEYHQIAIIEISQIYLLENIIKLAYVRQGLF